MVYGAEEVARFVDGERPDFSASVINDPSKEFGVEVTALYQSGSHARLQNIPDYFREIFAGRYRNADDRRELPVEEVTIHPHDGSPDRRLPALIQRFPDVPEHLRLIAAAISGKSRKARRYRRLHHVNLVVIDQLRRWINLEPGSLCKLLLGHHIPAVVWTSPFREAFYVTELKNHWVCVPLVMQTLLAELFGFARVVGPHVAKRRVLLAVLRAFGHHLERRSRGVVCVRGEGSEFEVLHRRYGFLLSNTKGVTVRDYLDVAYPRDARPLEPEDPLPVPRRVLAQRLRRYHESHTFEYGFAPPAKGPPPGAQLQRQDA